MQDESIIVPDFLPATFQDDLDGARRQVEDSHRRRPDPGTAGTNEPGTTGRAGAHARRNPLLSWLPASDLPMATAATVIGLIGVAALTAVWGWLAITHDSLWWVFAAGGAAVFVGLAVFTGLLHQRLRSLTTTAESPETSRALT